MNCKRQVNEGVRPTQCIRVRIACVVVRLVGRLTPVYRFCPSVELAKALPFIGQLHPSYLPHYKSSRYASTISALALATSDVSVGPSHVSGRHWTKVQLCHTRF